MGSGVVVTVNIHQAKSQLSALLKRAQEGEEVIIAKANKPVARLVPLSGQPKKRIAGLHAGKGFWMADDFDAPLPAEFWEGRASYPLNAWIREQPAKYRAGKRK